MDLGKHEATSKARLTLVGPGPHNCLLQGPGKRTDYTYTQEAGPAGAQPSSPITLSLCLSARFDDPSLLCGGACRCGRSW